MSRKFTFALAAALSLVSQVLLLMPARLAFIPGPLRGLLAWLCFGGSILLIFFYIRRFSRAPRLDWLFPAIQACAILGLYPPAREISAKDGFLLLLSGSITLLTTYALYVSSSTTTPSDKNEAGQASECPTILRR